MKKAVTAVAALVIMLVTALGVSTPSFAYSKAATITRAIDSNGNSVSATFALDENLDLDMVSKFWEISEAEQKSIIAYYGYDDLATSPFANGELDLTQTGASTDNPVTVTFSMVGEYDFDPAFCNVQAGGKWLYVLQQFADGTYKLIHAQSTADCTATAQFTDAGVSKILIIELDLGWEGVYTSEDIPGLATMAEVDGIQSATDAQGNPVNVTVAPLAADMKSIAVTQAYDLFHCDTPIAAADVNLDGTNVSADNPVTVTFSIAGVNAGDTIAVIHKKSDGSWENLPGTVANGTVTVTFTSFSPVLFARPAATTAIPEKPAETPVTSTTPAAPATAPQKDKVPNTGEYNMTAFWVMAAVCSGAGMVCSYKRKKSL